MTDTTSTATWTARELALAVAQLSYDLQAEQAVISSNAQVGVAMGNFLPRVGLVALWGGSSETLGGLASGSASVWNLAGELSGPIFRGGLLYAQYKGQQAFWEESKANYELTALNAFGEVSSIIVENNRVAKERRLKKKEQQQQEEVPEGETQLLGVFPTRSKAYAYAQKLQKQGMTALVNELDNGKWAVKVPKAQMNKGKK